MGAGFHGGFGSTFGKTISGKFTLNLQYFAAKVFGKHGSVSKESFEKHREFFLGKSPSKIKKEMEKFGYKIKIEKSVRRGSKAKKLVVLNPDKGRNVTMILVSPGSKRHGETSYVKISTTDYGRFKVVSNESAYKTDGKENAKVYFARKKK